MIKSYLALRVFKIGPIIINLNNQDYTNLKKNKLNLFYISNKEIKIFFILKYKLIYIYIYIYNNNNIKLKNNNKKCLYILFFFFFANFFYIFTEYFKLKK
jgi:hypothetical protein